jgi:hypothetical protein
MLSFPAMFMRVSSSFLETNQASVVTISHRLPMLAALAFWPLPENLIEANLMVIEKFEAMAEGVLAASEQVATLTLRAALGKTEAEDLASGMMSIAVAAAEPASKRAQANAERLSRA